MIDATLVWMDAPAANGVERTDAVAHDADAARALAAWASARGLRLSPPAEGSVPARPVDAKVATSVEADLQAAHDATTRLDSDAVERDLARAEALLLDHPELPEAAWLMAEVDRAWSVRFGRLAPRDPARAARAWEAAAALDGGRVAGVGEDAYPAAAPAKVTLDVSGDAAVYWDGRAVRPGVLRAPPGRHLVWASREGAVVWASWVTVAARTRIAVALPTAPACSADDMQNAAFRAGGIAAAGVRCPTWVAARAGVTPGSLRVALCHAAACGTEIDLAPRAAWSEGLPPEVHHARWPAWATWALVGAGAVGGTLAVLGAAGAFAPPTTTTTFEQGGVQTQ